MNRTPSTSPSALAFALLLFASSLPASLEANESTAPVGELAPPELVVPALRPPRDVLASVRGSGMELTADRAAELAAATAASIAHADALLAAARAGADRAFYGLVPRLDVVASYTRIPTDEQRLVPNSVTRDIDAVADPAARDLWEQHAKVVKDRYAVTSTVTFPVSDYFFELWPRYESVQGFAEARELGVEAERARVALSAREAYYALARARAAAAVQRLALEQAEQAAEVVESRARQGQVYRSEALQVRAELAYARAALVRSQGGVELAGTALRGMLELEPGTPIALEEDLLADLPASVETTEQLTTRAIGSRAEARALRRIIEARGRAVAAAKGSRLPSLVLQGHAEVGSPNSRLFLERSDPQAIGYVSVALSWSLDETLQGGPAIVEERAARSQAKADLRGLEDSIRMQVAEARVAYEAALRTREAAELGREAARESYRLRVVEFERGRALTSEVLDAVATLARAEMGLLGAAIDARVALAQLRRAVGVGDVTPGLR